MIARFFQFAALGTNLRREVLAGVTTFVPSDFPQPTRRPFRRIGHCHCIGGRDRLDLDRVICAEICPYNHPPAASTFNLARDVPSSTVSRGIK